MFVNPGVILTLPAVPQALSPPNGRAAYAFVPFVCIRGEKSLRLGSGVSALRPWGETSESAWVGSTRWRSVPQVRSCCLRQPRKPTVSSLYPGDAGALVALPRRGIVNASHQENAAGGYSQRSATIGFTFMARRAGR